MGFWNRSRRWGLSPEVMVRNQMQGGGDDGTSDDRGQSMESGARVGGVVEGTGGQSGNLEVNVHGYDTLPIF